MSKADDDDPVRRRRYAVGRLQQLTPEWQAAVVARLAELGKSRTWLAAQVEADKSAITVLLRPTTSVSRLVDKVTAVLGIPPPLIGADIDQSDIVELVGQLDEADRAMTRDFILRLLVK